MNFIGVYENMNLKSVSSWLDPSDYYTADTNSLNQTGVLWI